MRVVKPWNKLPRDFPCLEAFKALFDGSLSKVVSLPMAGELEPEDFQKFLPAKTILWFYYLLLCTDHSLAYWYFSSPAVAQESVTPVLQAELHIRICTSLVDTSVLNTFCGLIRQRSSLCNSDLAGRPCVLELMVVFSLKGSIWTLIYEPSQLYICTVMKTDFQTKILLAPIFPRLFTYFKWTLH